MPEYIINDEGESPGDIPVTKLGLERRFIKSGAGFLAATAAKAIPAFRLLTAADIAALSPSFTNLSVSGWERVGSLVVPTNFTAGDFTAERIWVPDQASSTLTGLINGYNNAGNALYVARLDSSTTSGTPGFRVQGAAVIPRIEGMRSAGTIASPTAVVSGNNLLAITGRGFYDSSNISSINGAAYISFPATENWSSSAQGAYTSIGATANGATASGEIVAIRSTGLTVTGVTDTSTGYRVNGAAAAGNLLQGDATNFVSTPLTSIASYTGYTPTVTQGGTVTSFTTNTARYTQIGKTVTLSGVLIVNNAGTAAGSNDVSVSLPVNFAFPGSVPGMGGTAQIYDSSADILYPAAIRITSATSFKMVPVDQIALAYGAGGLYLGNLRFTAALANADQIVFQLTYEAA